MRSRRASSPRAFSLLRAGASLALAASFALPLAGCGDDSTGPDGASKITVSGTLTGPNVATLPEGARVAVLWTADDGEGDYGYVFGSGTIDRASGRFTLTLPQRPPEAALNAAGSYRLGVGVIFVIEPGTTLPEGRLEADEFPYEAIIGAAGRYAVIYTAGDRDDAPTGWWRTFPQGYAVGRGVTHEETYDEFEPVAANSVQLIIDDPENIEFVNWS